LGVGILLYVVGRILGYVLQMFVSRQREYAADAAAKTVGASRPLISALEKIMSNPGIGSESAGAALGFMCTADPEPSDVFATHPAPEKRLAALRALED